MVTIGSAATELITDFKKVSKDGDVVTYV